MRFTLKFHRGGKTHKSGDLCATCAALVEVRGHANKEHYRHCSRLDKPVPYDVADCNQYTEMGRQSLYEMRQIAWPLLVNKSGNLIGFRQPKEAKRLIDDGKAKRADGDDDDNLPLWDDD